MLAGSPMGEPVKAAEAVLGIGREQIKYRLDPVGIHVIQTVHQISILLG
jgi:hypothetical protein